MATIILDTLKLHKRLIDAGFDAQQAQALAELQQETASAVLSGAEHEYHLDDLALKRDVQQYSQSTDYKLEALRNETSLKQDALRAELKRDIAETKADLIRWVVAVGLLQSSLIVCVLMKIAKLI